jgi:hypothetical protein
MPVVAHKLADGRYECQNCLKKFTKNPRFRRDPKFCKKQCCDEFHLNGGMSLKKLEHKIRTIVRDELRVIAEEVRGEMIDAVTREARA